VKNWKKFIVGFVAFITLVIVGIPLVDRLSLSYSREGDFAVDTVAHQETEIEQPVMLYGMKVNHLHVVEDVVKRNQRFVDLLAGYYVAPGNIQKLHLVPRQVFDFRRIAYNNKYVLLVNRDSLQSLQALIYETSPTDFFVFHFKDSLRIEPGSHPLQIRQREVAGVIGSSLAETIAVQGISPELTNRFVDIFAWQLDFQRLQKGDRFKLFYEEQVVEGRVIGIGKIGGIFFEHFNNPYYAIPFDQGNGMDYFDNEGKSLRKALLKYPIEFTRISSRYNLRRFHPVAGVFRAHRGTDFAAPAGTPIRSVGEGIILEARYDGNNGNFVKIRHNGTYTTQYLHLSRIASGMRPGRKVVQGETIGYVGSTGLSTGPHLCYRFWKNGVQVDALRVELPPSQPILDEFVTDFSSAWIHVKRKLDGIALPEPPILASSN